MFYYRAKKDAYDYFSKRGVVQNELLTKKERNKYVPYLSDCIFDSVEIPNSKVFTNFGVRFEIKGSETV